MGDHARLALRARRLAIRARPRGAARCPDRGTGRPALIRPWRSFKGRSSRYPASAALEILHRVDRGRAFADFEMQLRAGDIAGRAGLAAHLTTLDGLTL